MRHAFARIVSRLLGICRRSVKPLRPTPVRYALAGGYALCILLTVSVFGAYAQTTGTQSVEDTAQSLFQTFYTRWRWPICGLALIPAGWQWFSSDPRGKARALSICAGILVWALIPYFIALFRVVTNS